MVRQNDGYTFALSDEIVRIPVRYRNRYGVEIAADLYRPKGLDESVRHAALVIGPRMNEDAQRGCSNCTPWSVWTSRKTN